MKPFFLVFLFFFLGCSQEESPNDRFLEELMKAESPRFDRILQQRDTLEIQIIYTQIDRDRQNRPSFRSFYFHADSLRYFYPASTIKLPMVVLALEKINRLAIPGLTEFTPMFHDSVYQGQVSVRHDSTSASGWPSIDHYARKILMVSDNDASNRLYEFLGQREANEGLQSRGYRARILHRLERPLTPDENRHTEAVWFGRQGQEVYRQPMLVNADSILPEGVVKKGRGFMRRGELIHAPFDFTYKNFWPLHAQVQFLKALLFPESVQARQRLMLTPSQRTRVLSYMSQLPRESDFPPYRQDTSLYDAYCKFLMYGEERAPIPAHIRIFNKVGDAYGYLIDNAYVVDLEAGVEFMLAAVINTNVNGVYNDGDYAYESLGFPFLRDLGQLIYAYELQRPRQYRPDLSEFRLPYHP